VADSPVTNVTDAARTYLIRRGFALEYSTLGWNVIEIVVLTIAAISARSVALAGFSLDSPATNAAQRSGENSAASSMAAE
jgi:hypothetical protein